MTHRVSASPVHCTSSMKRWKVLSDEANRLDGTVWVHSLDTPVSWRTFWKCVDLRRRSWPLRNTHPYLIRHRNKSLVSLSFSKLRDTCFVNVSARVAWLNIDWLLNRITSMKEWPVGDCDESVSKMSRRDGRGKCISCIERTFIEDVWDALCQEREIRYWESGPLLL